MIEVAIKLHPEGYVPKHIRWSKQLAQATAEIDIPGGTVARIDGYVVMHKAARILSFQPHMHIRGKRQCLELIYPTGGSSRQDRDDQLRELQLQLAPELHLHRRRRAARPGRNDPARHHVARQLAGTIATTPTRRTGSATASARSTRWASRGSAGTT